VQQPPAQENKGCQVPKIWRRQYQSYVQWLYVLVTRHLPMCMPIN